MSLVVRLDQMYSDQVNLLVSHAFGYQSTKQKKHTFFDDFPIWNSDEVIRLGILDSGKLVSHVGVRLAEMRTHKGSENFALIGAVATAFDHRRKGHSALLMKEAIQISENERCSWTVLWGSEHAFYEKLDFKLNGVQGRAIIGDLALSTKDLRTSPIKNGITEKIFNYLCAEKTGIKIEPKDHDWVFAHKTIRWFYIDDPFSFVAFERGMDLSHIVHEAGGDATGIQKLLFHVHSIDRDAQIIAKPDTLSLLGFEGQDITEEYLCLARASQLHSNPKIVWNPQYWISGLGAC